MMKTDRKFTNKIRAANSQLAERAPVRNVTITKAHVKRRSRGTNKRETYVAPLWRANHQHRRGPCAVSSYHRKKKRELERNGSDGEKPHKVINQNNISVAVVNAILQFTIHVIDAVPSKRFRNPPCNAKGIHPHIGPLTRRINGHC
jgi:hypothetical protein